MKYSGFRRDVKRHVLTFSTLGQRQVTTCCTCAVTSRKKCHVSGCRRQAGDVCCLRCLLFLSVTTSRFSTHERIPVTDRTKNHLRPTLRPPWRVPPSCCTKIYPSLVPWQTSQTYAKKCLGQKQYLAGKVGEKVFNLTLMNKLIRIEWVSECHKTAYEAHGCDVTSMSKNERNST